MTTDSTLERLEALLAADHGPLPWQWLDSGGEPLEYDELQDAHGEQVATGFRDDINLDGLPPGHMVDGRLAAAAVNALPRLLAVVRAAEAYADHMDKREPYAAVEFAIKQAADGGLDFIGVHFDGDGCFAEMERCLAALDTEPSPEAEDGR